MKNRLKGSPESPSNTVTSYRSNYLEGCTTHGMYARVCTLVHTRVQTRVLTRVQTRVYTRVHAQVDLKCYK